MKLVCIILLVFYCYYLIALFIKSIKTAINIPEMIMLNLSAFIVAITAGVLCGGLTWPCA